MVGVPTGGKALPPTHRAFMHGDGGKAVYDYPISYEKPLAKPKLVKSGRFFQHGDGGHPVHSHVPIGTLLSRPSDRMNLPRVGGGFELDLLPPSWSATQDFSPGWHGYVPVEISKRREFGFQVKEILDKEGLVIKTGRKALALRALEVLESRDDGRRAHSASPKAASMSPKSSSSPTIGMGIMAARARLGSSF
eukprot:TRINITY_DN71326_c0_g1_i1.p1 TRINITY_DN71326_c0_g1~~TRINITY_DN71326_c0_g1_i1.p1  ORF type:complete len:193 (-),score=33.86 TRINITY_DN71326_c0_g1_i1:204-782(-)